MGLSWTRCWKEEFAVKKLRLTPDIPELLLQPEWDISPLAWLLYRLTMVVYTLGWCVRSMVVFSSPKWLIYLSQLTYCVLLLYFLVAFCNLAGAFTHVRLLRRGQTRTSRAGGSTVQGSCACSGLFPLPAPLAASLRVQRFLHVIAGSFSLNVSVLYWIFSYAPGRHRLDGSNIHIHIINSVQTLLDLAVSATPVHLCHYLHLLLIGCLYVLFTVIYWVSGGTGFDGRPYIYKAVDYGQRPVLSSVCVLAFNLLCLPALHFLLWNLYLLRKHLASSVRGGQLALSRERWWWRAGGGDPDVAVAHGTLSSSALASVGSKAEEGVAQSLLSETDGSYNAITSNI